MEGEEHNEMPAISAASSKRLKLDDGGSASRTNNNNTTKNILSEQQQHGGGGGGEYPPLDIEPCSIKRLTEHIDLLQGEVDEYQELIKARLQEMEQTRGRIEYLRKKRRAAKSPNGKCTHEGCTKFAQIGGVCNEHGANELVRICIIEGCTNQVKQKGGLCRKHGKRKYCSHEDCSLLATKGSLCNKHRPDYNKTGSSSREKSSSKKTSWIKECSHEGCTKFAQLGGVCNAHGANQFVKICQIEGCTNQAKQKGGLCRKHGKRKYCSHDGCSLFATKGSLCNRHRTDKKPRSSKKKSSSDRGDHEEVVHNGGGGGMAEMMDDPTTNNRDDTNEGMDNNQTDARIGDPTKTKTASTNQDDKNENVEDEIAILVV